MTDITDFARVVDGLESWDDWCAAWSAAAVDGGSAYHGPCAVSPFRGGGATVSGTGRISQPRARDAMTARAVLRAVRLPERATPPRPIDAGALQTAYGAVVASVRVWLLSTWMTLPAPS